MDPLEALWDAILSRQPERVRAALAGLNKAEQEAVMIHLRAMATEPGWHPEQAASAQAALDALEG